MRLQNPRGFPGQSSVAAACDNIAAVAIKRRRVAEVAVDVLPPVTPTRYLAALTRDRARIRAIASAAPARATCATEFADRELIYPTGHHTIKKGKRTEDFGRMNYGECVATVSYGATTFFFRATSLGANIFDSRDKSRRLLCEVRRELERLLGDDEKTAAICANLASVQPPPKTLVAPRLSAPDPTFRRPSGPRPEFHWKPMDEKLALEERAARLAV
jgi:hypothetical protein